ncbi:hypothetical protein AB0N79_40315 [Streptomyces microflavus]|uniref:hypothetical protein n=1 Tax=Streptomyces microflavus TaxID=1919 RepID=UPI00343B2782
MAGGEPREKTFGGRLRLVGQDGCGRCGDVGAGVESEQAEQVLFLGGEAFQGLVEHGPQTAFSVVQAVQDAVCAAEGGGAFGQRLPWVLGQQGRGDLQGQRQIAAC